MSFDSGLIEDLAGFKVLTGEADFFAGEVVGCALTGEADFLGEEAIFFALDSLCLTL